MFDEMGSYDEAFSQTPGGPAPNLRVRKTLGQQAAFWGANAVVLPLVAVCYLTISAEGLRTQMPVLAMRLSKLPLPGAGLLGQYDGFDRMDISQLMALVLFAAVTMVWVRVFEALMGSGGAIDRLQETPVLLYALLTVVLVIVLGDLAIFYAGLQAKAASGWSETSWYVAPLASVLYMAGLALLGTWHADYRQSGAV